MAVPSVKLNSGYDIPVLGLGTWKSKPGEVRDAVIKAIEIGYRHIDCALIYDNEKEVGEAIAAKIKDKTVTREQLFVTSKQKSGTTSEKDAENKTILTDRDYLDTWIEMEKLVIKKLVRSIGVSNFNEEMVKRIVQKCNIKPATNQFECHPYLIQKSLSNLCHQHGIVVTAYSPFASPDRPWAKPEDPSLLQDPKLQAIAKKYNKSVAQVLLKYQLHRGHVPIPKSVSPVRLAENLNVFDFNLIAKDVIEIESLDCNGRVVKMDFCSGHKYHPF